MARGIVGNKENSDKQENTKPTPSTSLPTPSPMQHKPPSERPSQIMLRNKRAKVADDQSESGRHGRSRIEFKKAQLVTAYEGVRPRKLARSTSLDTGTVCTEDQLLGGIEMVPISPEREYAITETSETESGILPSTRMRSAPAYLEQRNRLIKDASLTSVQPITETWVEQVNAVNEEASIEDLVKEAIGLWAEITQETVLEEDAQSEEMLEFLKKNCKNEFMIEFYASTLATKTDLRSMSQQKNYESLNPTVMQSLHDKRVLDRAVRGYYQRNNISISNITYRTLAAVCMNEKLLSKQSILISNCFYPVLHKLSKIDKQIMNGIHRKRIGMDTGHWSVTEIVYDIADVVAYTIKAIPELSTAFASGIQRLDVLSKVEDNEVVSCFLMADDEVYPRAELVEKRAAAYKAHPELVHFVTQLESLPSEPKVPGNKGEMNTPVFNIHKTLKQRDPNAYFSEWHEFAGLGGMIGHNMVLLKNLLQHPDMMMRYLRERFEQPVDEVLDRMPTTEVDVKTKIVELKRQIHAAYKHELPIPDGLELAKCMPAQEQRLERRNSGSDSGTIGLDESVATSYEPSSSPASDNTDSIANDSGISRATSSDSADKTGCSLDNAEVETGEEVTAVQKQAAALFQQVIDILYEPKYRVEMKKYLKETEMYQHLEIRSDEVYIKIAFVFLSRINFFLEKMTGKNFRSTIQIPHRPKCSFDVFLHHHFPHLNISPSE